MKHSFTLVDLFITQITACGYRKTNATTMCSQPDGATCHTVLDILQLLHGTFPVMCFVCFDDQNWPHGSSGLTSWDIFYGVILNHRSIKKKPTTTRVLKEATIELTFVRNSHVQFRQSSA